MDVLQIGLELDLVWAVPSWSEFSHQLVNVLQVGLELDLVWAVLEPLLLELAALVIQRACQLLPLLRGVVQEEHQAGESQIRRR